jgi:hypothetical protein
MLRQLTLTIIDSGHLEIDNTAEGLGKLTESVGRETDRLLKAEAIPLFHDTFLSGAAHVCVDRWAKEWLSGVIPRLSCWETPTCELCRLTCFINSEDWWHGSLRNQWRWPPL